MIEEVDHWRLYIINEYNRSVPFMMFKEMMMMKMSIAMSTIHDKNDITINLKEGDSILLVDKYMSLYYRNLFKHFHLMALIYSFSYIFITLLRLAGELYRHEIHSQG